MPESIDVKATLQVELSNEELKNAADEATRHMAEVDELEEEYKLIKREWNQKLKDKKLKIRKFCSQWHTQRAEREVDCKQYFDVDTKKKWYEYQGKKYHEEEMDEYEVQRVKQGCLFDDGANLPANSEGGQPQLEVAP